MEKQSMLLTVKDFNNKYPSWPSHSALRAIIIDASWGKNNFKDAFIRVGRRVLVDEEKFWEIVKANGEQKVIKTPDEFRAKW